MVVLAVSGRGLKLVIGRKSFNSPIIRIELCGRISPSVTFSVTALCGLEVAMPGAVIGYRS